MTEEDFNNPNAENGDTTPANDLFSAPMPQSQGQQGGQSVAEIYSDFFDSVLPGSVSAAPANDNPIAVDRRGQEADQSDSSHGYSSTISDSQFAAAREAENKLSHESSTQASNSEFADAPAEDQPPSSVGFFDAKLPGSQSIAREAIPSPEVDNAGSQQQTIDEKPAHVGQQTIDEAPSAGQQTIDEPQAQQVGARSEFIAAASELLGDFRLERKLGQGGMGEVWLAIQVSLDRPVAVKLLPKGFASQPQFVERFEREAKSAASLVHPNVIQVYAFGIERGAPYFAMEFVEGEDLQQRLEHQGQRPLPEIIEIMIGVASALAAAGDKAIVHRDIKPSNIMLDASNNVKVMDFGLAKATSLAGASLTQSGLIMGTPKYMSPEQARGDEVDKRSDLYSLGVVFYELLTGQLPFRSDTPAGLIFKHVYEAPPLPRGKNEDIPPFLEDVVMRLLEKDPDTRYDSAHDLLAELREYQSNQAYYLNGGERREPAPHNNPKVRAKSAETKTQTQTVVVERRSSGAMTFVILLLLLAIGAAVAYMGHQQKYWVIPYLPPVKGKVVEPTPQPDKPDKPEVVDKRVKVTFDLSLDGVTKYWNVLDPQAMTPVDFASSEKVLPGDYKLQLHKNGRKVLNLGFSVTDKGTLIETESKTPLAQFRPKFLPTDELLNAYQSGLNYFKQNQFDKALTELEKAKAIDPAFKTEGEKMTAQDLLTEARRKREVASEEQRNWANSLARAEKHAKDKNWRLAQIQLKEISKKFSRYATVEKLASSIEEKLKKIEASKLNANQSLKEGKIDEAINVLKAISDEVANDQQVETILAQANLARDHKKNALAHDRKAKTALQQQDYKLAQAELSSAIADFKKYLNIAADDSEIQQKLASASAKLNESSSLKDLVGQLQAAINQKKNVQIVELANAVLKRNAQHSLAMKARSEAQLKLDQAAIRETLKMLDSSLVSSDPMAAVKAFKSGDIQAQRMREFLKVARFTRSDHIIKSVKRNGDKIEAQIRWSFTVEFTDVYKNVARTRIQQISFVITSDKSTWIIESIQ